ncbi:hypothetical protein M6D93_14500 [Jatrophihabitans telluris]|uniref:Uncharacterized protein n=1 Tax=Jatrophihabitans telluris TaxID=2038343 RepID=A0ABY4QX37_9ACTN|nr:ribonuclease domain-containing protein [Jatrophihabitans telluris]UQX87504.1 hypothetical protein M6D93_14500 [Jatrophihabitans telluris]
MLNLRAALRRRPLLALIVLILLLVVGYAARGLDSSGNPTRPSHQHTTGTSGPAAGTASVTGSRRPGPIGPQVPGSSLSRTGQPLPDGAVALSGLPAQASTTVRLILRGGPFPYSRDGVVFDNAERLLAPHPHGYYHEYTVPTPGESDRGARRIITGRGGEYYYTGDHYASFVSVDITR